MVAREWILNGAPARWWHTEGERIVCDLCPRGCRLRPGQRGMCFVRANRQGAMVSTAYGRTTGLCVDPIEKKPLLHFYPGTSVLSFGTAGCNLACQYCQNWSISRARDDDVCAVIVTPERVAERALELGCRSVAFTYNDPVVFAELAIDTALACRARGIKAVAVTNGYISPAARAELFAVMDAVNVDLKGFTDGFYQRLCLGHLQPVLDTLRHVAHETDAWLEVTNLVIPGWNDDPEALQALAQWVLAELGPTVPLHFTAFAPHYRMKETPPTPLATLRHARDLARRAGLRHVYTGNIDDLEGQVTRCARCGDALMAREWSELTEYRLTPAGTCPRCGDALAGRFDPTPGTWGRRRTPVLVEGGP